MIRILIYVVVVCFILLVYLYIDGVTHDKKNKTDKKYYESKYKFEPNKYEIWNTMLCGKTGTVESKETKSQSMDQ